MAPRELQEASRRPQDHAKRPQDGPKTAPRGFKMTPEDGPGGVKTAPRAFKMLPRGPEADTFLHYNRLGEVFPCRGRGGVNPFPSGSLFLSHYSLYLTWKLEKGKGGPF